MRDAEYLRAQAQRCQELACQISDPNAAASLKADAAKYFAEAADMELQETRSRGGSADKR